MKAIELKIGSKYLYKDEFGKNYPVIYKGEVSEKGEGWSVFEDVTDGFYFDEKNEDIPRVILAEV